MTKLTSNDASTICSLMNIKKEYSKDQCQSLYATLFTLLTKAPTPTSATQYTRELQMTIACDYLNDFAYMRNKLSKKVSIEGDEKTLSRIISYKATTKDKKIAAAVMTHYYSWHKWELYKALSFSSKLSYHMRWLYDKK